MDRLWIGLCRMGGGLLVALLLIGLLAPAAGLLLAAPDQDKRFVIHVDGDRFVGRLVLNSVDKWLVWIDCGDDPFATKDFRKRSNAKKEARAKFPAYTRAADCPPS